MQFVRQPNFDNGDRQDIHAYLERHGATRPAEVRRELDIAPRAFGHHLAMLERDRVVETVDGRVRLAFEAGLRETHETNGIRFVIRPAREEDLTGLVGAIRTALGSGEYVRAESVADVVDREGVVLRDDNLESRVFFVATVGGDVVGWVHLKRRELTKLDHTAELTLGVLEAHQGRGIGSRLLERGLEWADEQGLERIYNAVPASNERAIAFFESRGFDVEAVREDHYKLDGRYIDEVMLATRL